MGVYRVERTFETLPTLASAGRQTGAIGACGPSGMFVWVD